METQLLKDDFRHANFVGLPTWKPLAATIAFLLNPGFRTVVIFRLQQKIYEKSKHGQFRRALAFVISGFNHTISGAEFIPGCQAGKGLVIRHPTGIVVGEGSVLGDYCVLQHGVTLGKKYVNSDSNNLNDGYPKVGNRVVIGTHSVLLGGITVGSNVTIGANSVVLRDIADGEVVYGVR